MTVQKQILKSCCGKSSTLITVTKPIVAAHIPLFEAAGFFIAIAYSKQGIFYCRKEGFVAICTFGVCKITIRCSGSNCLAIENEFDKVLNQTQI
jgi:hypothetical protein